LADHGSFRLFLQRRSANHRLYALYLLRWHRSWT
ncbi:hypothetical protein, partial [Vibrio sp. 1403]